MRVSDLEPGISLKQSSVSNEQMLESINRSMERLVAVVSDMEETLEVLVQDFIKEPEQMIAQEMT